MSSSYDHTSGNARIPIGTCRRIPTWAPSVLEAEASGNPVCRMVFALCTFGFITPVIGSVSVKFWPSLDFCVTHATSQPHARRRVASRRLVGIDRPIDLRRVGLFFPSNPSRVRVRVRVVVVARVVVLNRVWWCVTLLYDNGWTNDSDATDDDAVVAVATFTVV